MKIALDVMGTDTAPTVDVAGAVMAAREYGEEIILVGDRHRIETELDKHEATGLKLPVVHAEQAIDMYDKPNEVVRGKPGSSMHVGMGLVKDGEADAFVTAGNTGAALAVAMFHLRRIRGVRRPAITAVGELAGHLVTVVDVGANTDSKVEWLKQFALMGNLYTQHVLEIEKPRVGLLANGTEPTKGDNLVQEAYTVFENLPLQFIGNVEPPDLFTGRVDVVVADGYVGNITLKTYESTLRVLGDMLRTELTRDWRAKLGALLLRPYLRNVFTQLDPTRYGGAPLLGVNGVVIIAHGGSTANGIKNAIRQARQAVKADVMTALRDGLSETQQEESET